MNDLFGMVNTGAPAANVQNRGAQNRLSRMTAQKDRPSGGFADVVTRIAQKQAEDPSARRKIRQNTPHEAMALLSGSAMAAQTTVVMEDREPETVSSDMEVKAETAVTFSTAEEAVDFLENLIKNEYGGNLIHILDDARIVLSADLEHLPISEIMEMLKPQIQAALLREEAAVSQEGLPTAQEWELLDGNTVQGEESALPAVEGNALPTVPTDRSVGQPLFSVQAAFQRLARLQERQDSVVQTLDGEMAALIKEVPDGLVSAIDNEETFAGLMAGQDQSQDGDIPAALRKETPSVQDNRFLAFAEPVIPTAQASAVPADVRVPNVTPSQMISQIVQCAALRQHAEGTTQLQLVLNPAHLGRVNILLTATADGITARIRADNDAVRGILSSNVQTLQTQMREMGITMKEIDISGSKMPRNFTQNTGQNASQSHQQEGQLNRPGAERLIPISRFSSRPEPDSQSYAQPEPVPFPEEGGVDFRA